MSRYRPYTCGKYMIMGLVQPSKGGRRGHRAGSIYEGTDSAPFDHLLPVAAASAPAMNRVRVPDIPLRAGARVRMADKSAGAVGSVEARAWIRSWPGANARVA